MGGIVLSLVWMVVLRYGAGVMAWLTILMANLGMIACTMLAYEKASGPHFRVCRWGMPGFSVEHPAWMCTLVHANGCTFDWWTGI